MSALPSHSALPYETAEQVFMLAEYAQQQNLFRATAAAKRIPNAEESRRKNATEIETLQNQTATLQQQINDLQKTCQ